MAPWLIQLLASTDPTAAAATAAAAAATAVSKLVLVDPIVGAQAAKFKC